MMMSKYTENPQITIITVCYNAVASLEDTIENVSTFAPDVKYIVIDGASTDGTVELLKRSEKNIAHWVSEPDLGIYDAMNKGWELAPDNSHIIFLGAGDKIISLPEAAELRLNKALYGDVLVGATLFKSHVGFLTRISNTIHHQALLLHKSLLTEPPFNLKYRMYADFDLNQRLVKSGVPFVKSKKLIGYALPDGVSSSPDVKEKLRVIQSNYGYGYAFLALMAIGRGMAFKTMLRRSPVV